MTADPCHGNGWPSATTNHVRLDGTSFATCAVAVDNGCHTWRYTWNDSGMYFWRDHIDGAEPSYSVPRDSTHDWPLSFR
jgi:hypothetical protein